MNKTTEGPRARKMAQRCLAGKARLERCLLVSYWTLASESESPASAQTPQWSGRDNTDASRPYRRTQTATPPTQRHLALAELLSCTHCQGSPAHLTATTRSVLAELLSLSTPAPGSPAHQTHNKLMPQTRSQTKADKVDARVDAVAYYLAVAVPVIFLYTVAQNLGFA